MAIGKGTPTQRASGWVAALGAALERGDAAGAAALFQEDGYWRDLVSLTWNITTAEGNAKVRAMIEGAVIPAKTSGWHLDGDVTEANGMTEAWLRFETPVARGHGHVRIKGDKAWTLLTTMVELKGHEEARGPTRELGTEHVARRNQLTWTDKRAKEAAELGVTTQPYVLVIGAGQSGLALAARLRQLKVPTLVIEKGEGPGHQWRKRYKSLCLHDPVWYDHLPYLPFPEHWPIFTPKDKIADWLEAYAKVMELNVWGRTECKGSHYDEAKKEWVVQVVRDGKPMTLRPQHLVLATGNASYPIMPSVPGTESFKGAVKHSSEFTGAEGFAGKRTIVVGSNSSGHDICVALWEEGADITMVQRGTTLVGRGETLGALTLNVLYSEEALRAGITTEKADLLVASLPYKAMPPLQVPVYEELRRRDADFYARLEKVGFQLDFGEDNTGLYLKAMRVGGGYYIDTGGSDLLMDGRIKLKSKVGVERFEEDGVVLTDGSRLPADLVVFATGYGSMAGWVPMLVNQAAADKVGRVWGLGSATRGDPGPWESELRNMWKPTAQEGLWFMGGNLQLSRHYSQFLSLQLKARFEGIPTPMYGPLSGSAA